MITPSSMLSEFSTDSPWSGDNICWFRSVSKGIFALKKSIRTDGIEVGSSQIKLVRGSGSL
jgi:hypothetical protein